MKKLLVLATAITFALVAGCGGTSSNSTKVTAKTPEGNTTAETKVKP
jgi:hypothetical protein